MPAWLVLAIVVSLVLALAFQLASRRYGKRVFAYWLLIFLGFVVGEALAELWGWDVTRFGDLRVLPDLLGSAAVLALLWFVGV